MQTVNTTRDMSDNSVDQSIESMDQLMTISNDDLRHRLENEFDFSCGPITASTRSVYLKKLVKLIEEKHENNVGSDSLHKNGSTEQTTEEEDEPQTTARVSAIRQSPKRNRSSPRRPVDNEVLSLPTKTSTPKNRRQSSAAANKRTTSTAKSRKTLAVMPSMEPIMTAPIEPQMRTNTNSHSSNLNNYSSESSENEDKKR